MDRTTGSRGAVRPARPEDLPVLQEVERAAGVLFHGLGMTAVADDEPPSLAALSVFQRHGRAWGALLDAVAAWAAQRGLPATTLTTFADVPWNAPYYQRLGFRVLAESELTDGLRRIREHEAARGLAAWPRVTMRRPSAG